MADVKLTSEVRAVLERSNITGNNLILPAQLERGLYDQVNKTIVNAGGKWNRSAQAHVFPSDPRAKLGLILETGVSVDEKKKRQAFYTPPALADDIALAAMVDGCTVFEPSAGGGALVDACLKFGARKVDCCELDEEAAVALARKKVMVINEDFLAVTPPSSKLKYDRVIMNPPFSKNQDVAHVLHALKWIRDDGMLVAIMPASVTRPQFQKLIAGRSTQLRYLDSGAFKESGTNVATIVLTVFGSKSQSSARANQESDR